MSHFLSTVIGGVFGLAIAFLLWPTHTTTATTPPTCSHAATSAWAHLHALTDESGTRVPIEAIHADMAGLRSCR